MAQMNVKLQGIKEFMDSNSRLAMGMKKALSDTLNTMAREAANHARRGHPRMESGLGKTRYSDRTGNLTKSIGAGGATPQRPRAETWAGMEYAPHVEYGHESVRGGGSAYQAAIGGGISRTRTKAYPFMRPAMQAVLPTFAAVLDKHIARLLKGWGGKL